MRFLALLAAAALAASAGCSSVAQDRGAALACLFPKTKADIMTDEAIDRALDAPVSIDVPARVLVVPADELTGGWRTPSKALANALAEGLADSSYLAPALSVPLGDRVQENDPATPMQRLREKAARYRARFALIAFADAESETSETPLALLYAPLVTMLFVPGESVTTRVAGDAVLVDVKSGAIVFADHADCDGADRFVRPTCTREARGALEERVAAAAGKDLAARIERSVRHAVTLEGKGKVEAAPPGA